MPIAGPIMSGFPISSRSSPVGLAATAVPMSGRGQAIPRTDRPNEKAGSEVQDLI
jgi:hypothetical protein